MNKLRKHTEIKEKLISGVKTKITRNTMGNALTNFRINKNEIKRFQNKTIGM